MNFKFLINSNHLNPELIAFLKEKSSKFDQPTLEYCDDVTKSSNRPEFFGTAFPAGFATFHSEGKSKKDIHDIFARLSTLGIDFWICNTGCSLWHQVKFLPGMPEGLYAPYIVGLGEYSAVEKTMKDANTRKKTEWDERDDEVAQLRDYTPWDDEWRTSRGLLAHDFFRYLGISLAETYVPIAA